MNKYQGSCHCGNINFTFRHEAIISGLRCNCSICKRKGAVMSEFTLSPEEIEIQDKDNSLSVYQFDTHVAKHYFCKHCGIYPFHQTMRIPGNYRINLGCINDIDTNELTIDLFDGKSI